MHFTRNARKSIAQALTDTPVVLLTGPRQSGKSTLAKCFSNHGWTFDDFATYHSAKEDPEGFIQMVLQKQQNKPCVLDEAQRVPDIFRAVKKIVDQNKKPGMLILTGSANILAWDKMPDSLVGRMDYLTLYPLSLGEITGISSVWIDGIYDGMSPIDVFQPSLDRGIIDPFIFAGGYPEALKRKTPERRLAWIRNYILGMVEKDARDLGGIESPSHLYKILSLIGQQIGSTLNQTQLAQMVGVTRPTILKYLSYLELLYLSFTLKPWHRNLNKRLVKNPKVYLTDSGVLNFFLGGDKRGVSGPLVEQYVLCELQKHSAASLSQPRLYFYRTDDGQEIDFILEWSSGHIMGIEVKASTQVSSQDFKHLKNLERAMGSDFLWGIVFYRGDHILTFGDRLYAVPLHHMV